MDHEETQENFLYFCFYSSDYLKYFLPIKFKFLTVLLRTLSRKILL